MGDADVISTVGRLWAQSVGVNPEPRSSPRPLQLAGSSLRRGSLAAAATLLPPHACRGHGSAKMLGKGGPAAGFGPLQALGGSGRGVKYEPTPQV